MKKILKKSIAILLSLLMLSTGLFLHLQMIIIASSQSAVKFMQAHKKQQPLKSKA